MKITLRLYESGKNTGVFLAYVPSTNQSSSSDDAVLTILQGEELTATYIDPFDASEISTDLAGVDPFGRFFDSSTGELVDGVVVTIVDDATGEPAQVYGIDGVSEYPSTIVSGSTVTDEAGLVYELEPGQFVFPIMFAGTYRLVIEPPGSYTAPSLATASSVETLANAPFTIIDGSYLNAFDLDGTRDVNFDVPLDPTSSLAVTKSASSEVTAIGDFLEYKIEIENIGDATAPLFVYDMPPAGFRFQTGSANRDGAPIDDPTIQG